MQRAALVRIGIDVEQQRIGGRVGGDDLVERALRRRGGELEPCDRHHGKARALGGDREQIVQHRQVAAVRKAREVGAALRGEPQIRRERHLPVGLAGERTVQVERDGIRGRTIIGATDQRCERESSQDSAHAAW